jgi:pimeloyl-ACP methyl ester carboxylesterase
MRRAGRNARLTAMSAQSKPSIVFCHGLWADGSCFSKLIPTLLAEGHQVIAALYGLDTPEGDLATVIRTLGRVADPAILVGHSYGGSVITAASTDRVAGPVYIAALAPDADQTSQSLQDQFPTTDVFAHIDVADGRIWLLPDGIDCFADDLPEAEQQLVWATHYAPAADLFGHNAAGVARRSKPTWYIRATHDRTVHPDLQRFVAERMGATTHDVDSSRVPMLSHPDLVLDVIRGRRQRGPRLRDRRRGVARRREERLAGHEAGSCLPGVVHWLR